MKLTGAAGGTDRPLAPACRLSNVFEARRRIAPYVRRTPLVRSEWLSGVAGGDVLLKLECLQRTGSFKLRGAFNALIALRQADPAATVVTASAGNHGRGVATAARALGMSATIFTPRGAPHVKLQAIRDSGATLDADAPDYDEAERRAKDHARTTGAVFVSPYSHPDVIAGAATLALEVIDDAPDLGAFVVPVGGGGLIAGVGSVARALSRAIEVVGIEAAASQAMAASLSAGRIVTVAVGDTLADGLAGNLDPDAITFAIAQRVVDRMASVSEAAIASAIHGLASEEHVIVEGAGAAGVAALLEGAVSARGRTIAVFVSGGNIDSERFFSAAARATAPRR